MAFNDTVRSYTVSVIGDGCNVNKQLSCVPESLVHCLVVGCDAMTKSCLCTIDARASENADVVG